jgi:hypothetical protein
MTAGRRLVQKRIQVLAATMAEAPADQWRQLADALLG